MPSLAIKPWQGQTCQHIGQPPRSVPVGFSFFDCVFVGIVLAGIGGNIIAPRRV
jgi:hypothetical protein